MAHKKATFSLNVKIICEGSTSKVCDMPISLREKPIVEENGIFFIFIYLMKLIFLAKSKTENNKTSFHYVVKTKHTNIYEMVLIKIYLAKTDFHIKGQRKWMYI